MSMARCANCEKIIDTDFDLESNENGDCICDVCAEELGGEQTVAQLNGLLYGGL